MTENYGKKFESIFKKDFIKSVPNSTIDRLYDSMSGFKAISNISDFIGYSYPYIFYLECKTHKGASIPFDCISQYEALKEKVGIKGVRAGVVLWLYEKDKVLYVPISTITQMKKDGCKSVGIKALEKYNIYDIPSVKKRTYMTSNYSVLLNLKDGE